jgi:hypothetical protein
MILIEYRTLKIFYVFFKKSIYVKEKELGLVKIKLGHG